MKKVKVELLKPALEDIDNIAGYYARESGVKAAKKVTDGIFRSHRRIADFPQSGTFPPDEEMKKNGFRFVVSGEYISIYRISGKTAYIYHIFHGAREYSGVFKGYLRGKA